MSSKWRTVENLPEKAVSNGLVEADAADSAYRITEVVRWRGCLVALCQSHETTGDARTRDDNQACDREVIKTTTEIQHFEAMAMKCSDCETENPEGAKFCQSCGRELETNVPRRCVSCGRPIPHEALVCQYCGFDYHSQILGAPPPGVDAQTPSPSIKSPDIRRRTEAYTAVGLAVLLVLSNLGWFYATYDDSTRYYDLSQDYDGIQNDYNSLLEDYSAMQEDYNAMRDDYGLLEYYLTVYETFRLDSTAADFYECVREASGILTGESWVLEATTQERVGFAADLSMHDQGKPFWPLQEDLYYNYYGTHSYDDAKTRLEFLLTMAGVAPGDSHVTKIGKILECVCSFVDYSMDMTERFYSPWEILAYRSGDCEDFSILASALFELAGIESAIGFFTDNYDSYHAMVLVNLYDLGPHEFYWYDDLSDLGLSSGPWIMIEPQTTLDYQADASWMEQWDILAAAET
ncbi:MAG: zinc ribbon domain-containing protein [Candidatus Thermoplasmatota archaeon]|nr:zinc ribbon domain-containing protein [Candidatus Thermoplasmatota archaeon]